MKRLHQNNYKVVYTNISHQFWQRNFCTTLIKKTKRNNLNVSKITDNKSASLKMAPDCLCFIEEAYMRTKVKLNVSENAIFQFFKI